jgi:hypothetical protein
MRGEIVRANAGVTGAAEQADDVGNGYNRRTAPVIFAARPAKATG